MASARILGHHGSMARGSRRTWQRCASPYDDGTLDEADLADTPLVQFSVWLEAARAGGLPEPNAMVLATVDSKGTPRREPCCSKGVDPRGFTFTNYTSRKAEQMAGNPRRLVVFPWIVIPAGDRRRHRRETV